VNCAATGKENKIKKGRYSKEEHLTALSLKKDKKEYNCIIKSKAKYILNNWLNYKPVSGITKNHILEDGKKGDKKHGNTLISTVFAH